MLALSLSKGANVLMCWCANVLIACPEPAEGC